MSIQVEAFLRRLHDPATPPLVMGVLNLTPDSFSDGGRWLDPQGQPRLEHVLEEARAMAKAGAQVLDVGGESTRPGATAIDPATEARRVLPVLEALAREELAWLSVDTQHAATARQAVELGAVLVNDVSAGRRDPELWPTVARAQVPYVLMHMQGDPRHMQEAPHYQDVAAEVFHFLQRGTECLMQLGLPRGRIVLDPGIGFGKSLEHNLALFQALGPGTDQAWLVGASRKRFIAGVEELAGVEPSSAHQRLGGSLAATLWAAQQGARLLRVHDVAESVQALRVWNWLGGRRPCS